MRLAILLSLAEVVVLAVAIFERERVIDLLFDVRVAFFDHWYRALIDLINFKSRGAENWVLLGNTDVEIRVVGFNWRLLYLLLTFLEFLHGHRIVLTSSCTLWLVPGASLGVRLAGIGDLRLVHV